jgi:ubiquinone/menaquinone biosynthesis C-methylase UbiE
MANPLYWERECRTTLNDHYSAKINKIRETIPKDIRSIVDIGCGNGVITNELAKYYDIVGIDRSELSLRQVKTKKIQASSDYLSLSDNTFDLVLCSEVLEHLEDDLFSRTVDELKRVSHKYIFITVPNNENINKALVRCPGCGHIFNKTYHLRRLNIGRFKKLFSEYAIVTHFSFGNRIRGYHRLLEKIKHTLAPADAWIPPKWTPDGYRETLCPKCSHEFNIGYRFNLIAFLCDTLNTLFSPKRKYQLFMLLEKKSG